MADPASPSPPAGWWRLRSRRWRRSSPSRSGCPNGGRRSISPSRSSTPGDAGGLGRTVAFHTRGWLPYTLRWQARLVEDRRPHGWTIAATGDLAGRGVWTLAQQGGLAAIGYDWRIEVEKPLLKPLTPVLKPVYAANHRWAMARGLEGLRRELVRRRAAA